MKDLPKRLVDAFSRMKTEQVFERVFGDVFREMQDQATGTSIIKDASVDMAGALTRTFAPLERFAGAVNAALLAAAVLALGDEDLARRLDAYRRRQTESVAERPVDGQ